MAWTPAIQVADLTKIADNILSYIETNDADALFWANDSVALPEFAKLYSNASGRLATLFPQLIVLDQEHLTEEGTTDEGDVLVIPVALTLEVAITGSNADVLTLTTKKYAKALESMLANITSAELTNGMATNTFAECTSLQTAFDVIQGYQKAASSWMQIFQTRVTYKLISQVNS